jgi:hypothetical protein
MKYILYLIKHYDMKVYGGVEWRATHQRGIYRGINVMKYGYQPRFDFADSHNILTDGRITSLSY